MAATKQLVRRYVKEWSARGYGDDIPDEVPHELMKRGLAPSYKAIAMALLNNDMNLTALGFQAPKSSWYNVIKKIEIEERESNKMADTNQDVLVRIKELKSTTNKSWGEIAEILNQEKRPSLSGKPWSSFMVMNYMKPKKSQLEKTFSPALPRANFEPMASTPEASPISSLEARVAVLQKKLMAEIMRNIELQTRLVELGEAHQ